MSALGTAAASIASFRTVEFDLMKWENVIMTKWLKRIWEYEEGATMVEYAIMAALVAAVGVAAVTTLGQHLPGMFSATTNGIVPAG